MFKNTQMSSSSQDLESNKIEDPRYNLPTFEEWFKDTLSKRKDAPFYFDELTLQVLFNALHKHQYVLQKIAKDHNGFVEKETDEQFELVQKEYSYWYAKLNLIRGFLLQYYHVQPPNWQTEILPEKYYIGCLLNEEDFIEFVTKHGVNKKLKPDGIQAYEEELERQRKLESTITEEEEEEFPVQASVPATPVSSQEEA